MKSLVSKLKKGVVAFGLLGVLSGGCSSTKYYTNYKNPEQFVYEEEEGPSNADLLATLGSVIGITADNEKDAALGVALQTYGSLKSNKEAAEKSKAEVNILPPTVAAMPDNLRVPEYNLEELKMKYEQGHLFKLVSQDLFETNEYIEHLDGLQYLFTFSKVFDLNYDGFDFEEYIGMKRNFTKEEKINLCVGFKSSGMKVITKKRRLWANETKMAKTTAAIKINVFNEADSLILHKIHKQDFYKPHETKLIFEPIDTSNLKSGLYLVEVEYQSDFDFEKDAEFYWGGEERIKSHQIKKLKQYFNILPDSSIKK